MYADSGDIYGYTDAWIDLRVEALSNHEKYKEITGKDSVPATPTAPEVPRCNSADPPHSYLVNESARRRVAGERRGFHRAYHRGTQREKEDEPEA